jgi:lipid-A-disaccharide synthase
MGEQNQIMLVVGEASGDIHGAQVVQALLARDPNLKIFGVGGERLQQTRFEALYNVSQLTGMGLVELAGNLKTLWQALRRLRRALRERRPRLLILIDFPDFNLRLARTARTLNVPVLYYVSPQVWAWRRRRVRQIARFVDHMAVVFPFEAPFYHAHGVRATFVGHPLLDAVAVRESRDRVLARLGLDPKRPVVALLPGSRRREVQYHLPVMAAAARRYRSEDGVQFVCIRAGTIDRAMLKPALNGRGWEIPIVEESRYDVINAADLVWAASGTATVESALLLKPMIIVYRVSWLTYLLARLLVRVEHVGMVNIIAGERLVPELIQSGLSVERLLEESRGLLRDRGSYQKIVARLSELRGKLGQPGAGERVAELALSMIAVR